jgi:hypothetical protein
MVIAPLHCKKYWSLKGLITLIGYMESDVIMNWKRFGRKVWPIFGNSNFFLLDRLRRIMKALIQKDL